MEACGFPRNTHVSLLGKRCAYLSNEVPVRNASNQKKRATSTLMKESPIDNRKTVGMNNARRLLYLTPPGSRFVSTSRASFEARHHSHDKVKPATMLCAA